MKILCSVDGKSHRVYMDIVAILADSNLVGAVAASKSSDDIVFEERDLPIEHQLTSAQKEAFFNFVRSAVSVIRKFGFEIVDSYQSSISYSYYVQFTPTPYVGFEDDMLELDVKFRLSEHFHDKLENIDDDSTDSDNITDLTTKTQGVIFQSFVVEGVRHDDIAATLLHIRHICEDLKAGDYSKLQ